MRKTNASFQLINTSELNPEWNWLHQEIKEPGLNWMHCSSHAHRLPRWMPKKKALGCMLSAQRSIQAAKTQPSLLISHGPRPTFYSASFASLQKMELPHLAVSFTFTELPTGIKRKLMSRYYRQVDRFLSYSTMEKKLYADYFDLDESKFDMVHWSVHAPKIDAVGPPLVAGQYICAIGSQGRDYRVLFKAIEKLKHIKLVVVVHPENLIGLTVPDNVKVYTNIPLEDCNNIVHYSQFMVLPLLHDKVPCGHSSLVSAMFHKKALLITDARTVNDYVIQDETGRYFPHRDDGALSREIEDLWESPADVQRLAHNGHAFAHEYCTERTMTDYFRSYLYQMGKLTPPEVDQRKVA